MYESGSDSLIAWGLAVGLIVAALGIAGFGTLARHRAGRIALLVAAALLPLSLSAGTVVTGMHESSRTSFCLSCHEMQNHGKSLFVDNPRALAATHYQNRLIDRDSVCYSCHTDYAMFGDVKAKWNGLKHVWVHYFGTIPQEFKLYEPYQNYNCLHCHEDARRYVEAAPHREILPALRKGETSCLSCHRVAHDMENVAAGQFWQAADPGDMP